MVMPVITETLSHYTHIIATDGLLLRVRESFISQENTICATVFFMFLPCLVLFSIFHFLKGHFFIPFFFF